jgi:hypothetical protein
MTAEEKPDGGKERALALAKEWHCRYCDWIGPDKHPAMKCNGDVEDAAREIGVILARNAELLGLLRELIEGMAWTIEHDDDAAKLLAHVRKALDGKPEGK